MGGGGALLFLRQAREREHPAVVAEAGAEYFLLKSYGLRLGYQFLRDSVGLTVGFGLRWRGRILIDRATGQTSNPRYFSGGDCTNGGREVVDAVADGKRAALGITARLASTREVNHADIRM